MTKDDAVTQHIYTVFQKNVTTFYAITLTVKNIGITCETK